jgi:hypothetical protein
LLISECSGRDPNIVPLMVLKTLIAQTHVVLQMIWRKKKSIKLEHVVKWIKRKAFHINFKLADKPFLVVSFLI